MKPGDILLFKGEDNILSKIIVWGTGSKYSHVAVCVSPDMALAIEAMAGKGVRAIDIRRIPSEYDVYRVKGKHGFNLDKTVSYLVDKLNSRYDYLGVIFLGVIKLLAKIGLPLKDTANRWQIKRDYFCSELCYEAFFHGGGLDIVPEVPEADITSPGDISKSSVIEMV
jgi:uncharacterized protein YycO